MTDHTLLFGSVSALRQQLRNQLYPVKTHSPA